MFVALSNTPRDYAWGSRTAISELFATPASGGPEAELWLGAHPASPSRILNPSLTGGAETLDAWIDADPQRALGPRFAIGARLPFLLKVLAIDAPLSLQAHPTPEQAREGFARENAAGLDLAAPERNYRDAYAKPELVFAISDRFEALCGFREPEQVREIISGLLQAAAELPATERLSHTQLAALSELRERATPSGLPALVAWLSSGSPVVTGIIDALTRLASELPADPPERFSGELATVRLLAGEYPGDPGIVISLLLNQVTLTRGQTLYLPAGNIHAYLRGVGVELMAASDNVLRGGLTPKHVDVPELLRVLDFRAVDPPHLAAEVPAPGVQIFRPDVPDFVLVRFDGSVPRATFTPLGPAIALCTGGSVTVSGALSGAGASVTLNRGDAIFITPDEGALSVSGTGELFLATTG
ncbi:MAG: mannose-6-phosphate isomerase, class I [Microbacteriaceae bacterium]|nr:mannose-6-phosphate isomerase, class I [Microbacteriaceae bacterium]